MAVERTSEGWQLSLGVHGRGRYLGAAFLVVWLCGWAIGEAFVIWFLIRGAIALLTSTPPGPGQDPLAPGLALVVGLFLLVWLTFWTIGGIAAISELFRLLWGEDRIVVTSGRVTVTWRRGPIRRSRTFERDAIRRIALVGPEDRLTLQSSGRSIELSRLGTRAERIAGAAGLRAELRIGEAEPEAAALPEGWEEVITPEGERALVANPSIRRTQARVASVLTLLLAAATFAVGRATIGRPEFVIVAIVLVVLTIAATAGTLWLARGRWEWAIRSGRLTLRKRDAAGVRDVFEARRLVLDGTTDSDGDTWYEVLAMADAEPAPARPQIEWRSARTKHRRIVARRMNDAAGMHGLATWLARATGVPLEDRTLPEAREAQLAELRAMLETSGRFGRWAAKLIDRMDEKRRRAG